MTDLVQIFEDAATDSGYRFAYGAKDILNYELGKNVTLTSGEYVIMVFPMVETANVANSAMNGFRVSTQIWIGRKFDVSSATGTKSNLDETERQKYDRRLKALRLVMDVYIQAVFCSTDLELISARVFRELNKFATNIDFMTADIVFRYDLEYEPAIVLPAPVSAEIGAEANNLLVITFNKSLNEDIVPDISAFTTSGITGDVQPESIEITGAQVKLTIAGNARCDDTVTVSYTSPEVDPLEDLFENLCLTFADFEVTNNIEILYDNEPVVIPNGTSSLLRANEPELNLEADGAGKYVQIELWVYWDGVYVDGLGRARDFLEINNNAVNWLKIANQDNSTTLYYTGKCNNVAYGYSAADFFNDGAGWYKIKFNWTDTTIKLYRNDIEISSEVEPDLTTMVATISPVLRLMRGAGGGIFMTSGMRLFGFKYWSNSLLRLHCPICEEGGNIAWDVSGNDLFLVGQDSYNERSWERQNNQDKYLKDYGYRLQDEVLGLLNFDGSDDIVNLSGWSAIDIMGSKVISFQLQLHTDPSGNECVFSFQGDTTDWLSFELDHTNNVFAPKTGGTVGTYDFAPYIGENITIEITKSAPGGVAQIDNFKINGVSVESAGAGDVVGNTSTKSAVGCRYLGSTTKQLYLSSCYVWNLQIQSIHHWQGQPEGNTNDAWVDTIGSVDGSVVGSPSTIDLDKKYIPALLDGSAAADGNLLTEWSPCTEFN